MKTIPGGAYPAMITPFTLDGAIDYPAVARLMKWYEDRNCAGVLALCASSETEKLTLEERYELAKFIVEHKGKMTIVVSGHNGDSIEEQIEEMFGEPRSRGGFPRKETGMGIIEHFAEMSKPCGVDITIDNNGFGVVKL